MSGHKFKAKQLVDFVAWDFRLTPLGQFEIVRVLPVEWGVCQYRIKSIKDGHERVVLESELS
jgi:hypothetical protein